MNYLKISLNISKWYYGFELILCTFVFFTDLCELKTCLNSGTCVAGNCVCAEGFSGDLCQNSQCEIAPVSQGTSIRLVEIDGAR